MLKKIGMAAGTGVLGLSMLVGAGTIVSAQTQESSGVNFFERLASKLGITEEKLSVASKEVKYEIIDEKVASGELDSERAEEIKNRIEESEGGFGFMGKPFNKEMRLMRFGNSDVAAEFLGATEEEIRALRDEGLSMYEILEKYGKSEEDFHEYMEENRPFMEHHSDMMSDFLGISVEEFKGLQEEGLSSDEILEKYGKTDEDFRAYMQENKPERKFLMRMKSNDTDD